MTPTIEDIDRAIQCNQNTWDDEAKSTIAFSLRVLKRLMGEPSKGMNNAGAYSQLNENEQADVIFTTMRDQLLREVENDTNKV